MKILSFSIFCLVLYSCNPGNLKHERYIENNLSVDTIVVINPDFDDAIDTIIPGESALLYDFEILDTKQEYEPCKWIGGPLDVRTLNGDELNRSVTVEDFWTYTISGDKNRIKKCTFIVTDDDF